MILLRIIAAVKTLFLINISGLFDQIDLCLLNEMEQFIMLHTLIVFVNRRTFSFIQLLNCNRFIEDAKALAVSVSFCKNETCFAQADVNDFKSFLVP